MIKKIFYGILGMLLAVVSIFPIQSASFFVKAEENEKFIIVDDTKTDKNEDHYFTYNGDFDTDTQGGRNGGWVADDKAKTNQSQEAKTQHWVWKNDDNGVAARSHTYDFTFTGTGVEIYGIPNDSVNVFTLDNEKPEEIDEASRKNGNTPVVLYSKQNLDNAKHTVKVSLPNEGKVTGLQVCYAKVFGAKESLNEKEIIKPNMQDGSYNVFKYTAYDEKQWTANKDEAYIDLGESDSKAEQCYYEIPFVGNRIDIYAIKSPAHGKVRFSIDGKEIKDVDLYKTGNREETKVYSVKGLDEGPHTLKCVTLNEKSGSNIVNQVVRAEVYHLPYVLNNIDVESNLDLFIESTHKLNLVLDPVYAKPQNLKFKSKDSNIVSVDEKGNVTAKKIGNTQITVSADGVESKTVNVTVKEQVKAMSGSIVDENLQWTQTKREEVSKMGTTSKELTAWKADKAIAEFVVYAKQSSLKNVTLEVSDFTNGKHKISKDNVIATFIKSTKAFTGNQGYGYRPGSYPVENETNRKESSDILYTTEPTDISYDRIQPVWVEINVPKDTHPGVYTGTIKVTSEDVKDKELSFTFNVKVQDTVLLDVSTYGNTFDVELWQYPYSSAEYYGVKPFSDEHMKILESIMLKYKSVGGHAITTTISEDAWDRQTYSQNKVHYPSMVKWNLVEGSFDRNGKISENFKFEYDFSDFDKWVQFNKDLGIGDKIVLYSIAPWHNSFTYWIGNDLHKTGYRVGSDTYNKVWKDFFRAMVDHLDEKGWFDDAYVGIDERGLTHTAFDLLETVKNKDNKSLKTAGAMDTLDRGHVSLAMRIDDLNVGDTSARNNPANFNNVLKMRKEKGLRTTLYSCTGHAPGNFSLSAPAESYWSMMFAYKSGTSGFLRWAYDAWVKDPLNDTTHSSFEAGDCFLVFPDLKDAKNPTVKSSLRLEKMAQGVRDINKLIMMSKQYPELQADIDALLNNVQTKYEQSGYFLTDAGKVAVAKDMNMVHDGIDAITDKYLALRDKDDINIAKQDLTNLLETAKSHLEKMNDYTEESYKVFKIAYDDAVKLLENDNATLVELRDAIGNLREKMDGLALIKVVPWEELTPAKPIETPEKPNSEQVEDGEKPSTGVSTNTALLWTVVLGAGAAVALLANKKRKIQR